MGGGLGSVNVGQGFLVSPGLRGTILTDLVLGDPPAKGGWGRESIKDASFPTHGVSFGE